MIILRTASLLFLQVASTLAIAQSNPRAIQEEDKYVRPLLIVAPAFPQQAPTDKLPVEIRVSGSVGEDGVMVSPEFSPLEGNEKYINAIKDVIPHWRFRTAVDNELCAPVASNGVLLVWFEEKEGKPSVSVSTPKAKPVSEPVDGKPRPVLRNFVVRPKVEYPVAARRLGVEGAAELLFKVSQQGEVLQTRVLYSLPNKQFGDHSIYGSRRVSFTAGTSGDDPQKTICILVPFTYCLENRADYPYVACANRKN